MNLKQSISLSEKAVYSVEESMALLGLSRQTIYNEINNGRLLSFKVGNRRLIPSEAISEWKTSLLRGSV